MFDQEASALSHTVEKGLNVDAVTRVALWIADHDVAFRLTSFGMIVMLLWAGAYKMTASGAEGIVPLVTNSPFVSWQFKLLGTYHGADIIGSTEWCAAILMLIGYLRPKAGIFGAAIAVVMFSTTSTMLITTPGTTIAVHGIRYMSFLGLFLYKDFISLGVALFLIGQYGKRTLQRSMNP